MKIEIKNNQKQKMFIKAEAIMKYLTAKSDELDTLIMCKSAEVELMTNDNELYKGIGAITEKNKIDFNRLVKFLEVVDIRSYKKFHSKDKPILTDKDVQDIQDKVGGKNG